MAEVMTQYRHDMKVHFIYKIIIYDTLIIIYYSSRSSKYSEFILMLIIIIISLQMLEDKLAETIKENARLNDQLQVCLFM